MPPHDAYARRTPYELLLPSPEFAEERFPRIEEEADARGSDPGDPGAFVMLAAAGDALRQLRPPDEEAESIHRYGALLFHAFHFWRADRPLWLLTTHVARYLVETDAAPADGEARSGGADTGDGGGDSAVAGAEDSDPARSALPAPAGYLQLPRHLFWSVGDPPEPVDGLFWAADEGRITLLVVLGIRPDRPGFSVVPVPTLPMDELGEWATNEVRDEGEDFRTTLPGGEIENLYSLVTAAEAVKLAARTFRYLDEHPEAAVAAEAHRGSAEPTDADGGPSASGLPYRRITLS